MDRHNQHGRAARSLNAVSRASAKCGLLDSSKQADCERADQSQCIVTGGKASSEPGTVLPVSCNCCKRCGCASAGKARQVKCSPSPSPPRDLIIHTAGDRHLTHSQRIPVASFRESHGRPAQSGAMPRTSLLLGPASKPLHRAHQLAGKPARGGDARASASIYSTRLLPSQHVWCPGSTLHTNTSPHSRPSSATTTHGTSSCSGRGQADPIALVGLVTCLHAGLSPGPCGTI